MSRSRRIHHPGAPGPSEAEITLSREESHHLTRVLRSKPGDAVSVFDGGGREWEAVVSSVHGGSATVRLGAEITVSVEPTLEVVLFQALCRSDRMEWAIQKCTEVGVAGIRIFRSERVGGAELRRARPERWRRIALEAAKQSGRRRLPFVEEQGEGPPPSPPPGGLAVILTGTVAGAPIGGLLARPRPGSVWLAVGPEGGFSASETEDWRAAGWEPAHLGPRTLRTETAGVVAASLVLHVWDDLGKSR